VLKHLHIYWSDVVHWLAVVFSWLWFNRKHGLPEIGRAIIREVVRETIASLKRNLLGRPKTLRPKLVNATVSITGAVNVRLVQAPI
jgi:hypothetical protein